MIRLTAAAFALLVATSSFAQTTPAPQQTTDEVLRALLAEVRALRVALQQNTAHQLRGQLLLERLRLQQQVVRDLTRESEQRGMVEDASMTLYLEEIEERLRTESSPEARRNLEHERDQLRRRLEQQKKMAEETRARQQRQEARLVEERQRLDTLEAEIAALMKEITR